MTIKAFNLLLVFLVLAIVLMLVSTMMQKCDNDSQMFGNKTITDSLMLENQTLLCDIENIEQGIKERDSVISVLSQKVKLTNKVVYIYKKKRDEEINAIGHIVPDSLYLLLSRL